MATPWNHEAAPATSTVGRHHTRLSWARPCATSE